MPLRETDETLAVVMPGITRVDASQPRPGIERLGPPPYNRSILKRGGVGWILSKPVGMKTHDPRITLRTSPGFLDVTTALARELAFRAYAGRKQNLSQEGEARVEPADGEYGIFEGLFVVRMVSLTPNAGALTDTHPTPATFTPTSSPCNCGTDRECCSPICGSCSGR